MRAATQPVQRRPEARLLVIHADGRFDHAPRAQLAHHLSPGDLVVANDAATIPASLGGLHEPSGAAIEVRLAGRLSLAVDDVYDFRAIVFGAGDHRTHTEHRTPPPTLRVGDALTLGPLRATVTNVLGHPRLVGLSFGGTPNEVWGAIARHGKPIQYAHIDRPLMMWDAWTRVAALPVAFEPPSASFVIDWAFLKALQARKVGFATLTHAAGISSTGDAALDARLPFDEAYHLPETTVRAISRTKAAGGRVVALGTTVTRALEHASSEGGAVRAGAGLATQRIGPHSRLRVVDAIVSGAHEPGESHYELLRAFANDAILGRMSHSLTQDGYRSHEFGDAVFIMRSAGHRADPRPTVGDVAHEARASRPLSKGRGGEPSHEATRGAEPPSGPLSTRAAKAPSSRSGRRRGPPRPSARPRRQRHRQVAGGPASRSRGHIDLPEVTRSHHSEHKSPLEALILAFGGVDGRKISNDFALPRPPHRLRWSRGG